MVAKLRKEDFFGSSGTSSNALVQLHFARPTIIKIFQRALQWVLLVLTLGGTSVPTAAAAHPEHLRQNICTATAATTSAFHRIQTSLIIEFFLLGVTKDVIADRKV
jgi:hypothetical protein